MKRATIIIASILVILGAGGLFYTKQFSQNSESTPQKATYNNSKNKKKLLNLLPVLKARNLVQARV